MSFRSTRSPLLALFLAASAVACAPTSETAAPTTEASDLTQSKIAKLSNAKLDAVRARYASAIKTQGDDFFGYAAAIKWGTHVDVSKGLNEEQLTFLANELIHEYDAGPDTVPFGVDLAAEPIAKDPKVSTELRLGSVTGDLDEAVKAAQSGDGIVVARYAATAKVPNAKPTAGALLFVDLEAHEALIVYGRRGPTPLNVKCTVTEMIAYEFEESLSKDEYPLVDAFELPLTGDVGLDIGVNSTRSNSAAAADGEDYSVTVTKTASSIEVVAKGEFFHGKLLVSGNTGAVWGDRDGNGRPNKAANLSCKGAPTAK